jgi:hypothetical protein
MNEVAMVVQLKSRIAAGFAGTAALAVAIAFAPVTPAQALTMKECSTKYKAAQTAGTAKDVKWNDFRKAECGANANAAAPAATTAAAPAAAPAAKPATTTAAARPAPAAKPAAAPAAASGPAVFPTAVDTKYSKEAAGKARMHTCVDQYNANKTSNANGGLKWIQKGGGYYSECTKRLKG